MSFTAKRYFQWWIAGDWCGVKVSRYFRKINLATPNYGYEKRQKELAKKRKKEDKLKQNLQDIQEKHMQEL